MIEFVCEGCGDHVYAFGRVSVPVSGLCAVCEWLCEYVPDPEAMMALRLRMRGDPIPAVDRDR